MLRARAATWAAAVLAVVLLAPSTCAAGCAPMLRWAVERRATAGLEVDAVRFVGNDTFDGDVLLQYMQTKPGNFFRRSLYDRRLFLRDLANVERFYMAQGFLLADVELDDIAIDPDSTRVEILVGIFEGDRWSVDEVTFEGCRAVSESELRSLLRLRAGGPFLVGQLDADRKAVLDEYAKRSYLDARVRQQIVRDDDARTASVQYTVVERERAVIASIDVVGDNKTRKFVVERELTFVPGEYFDFRKIGDSQANLYKTGLFNSVWIEPAPGDTGRVEKKVVVRVAERPSGDYHFTAAYAAIDGAEVGAGIRNRNVQGQATTLGLKGRYSERSREAEVSAGDPWFLGRRVAAEASAHYDWSDEESFVAEKSSAEFILSKKLSQSLTVEGGYRFERTIVLESTDPEADLGANYTSNVLLAGVFDTRDDIMSARRGTYLRGEVDLASSLLGGTNDFVRLEAEWRGYAAFRRGRVVALGLRAGYIEPLAHDEQVPVNERYLAGGEGSVRGFPRHSLGPVDETGEATGGRVLAIVRGEYRFPVFRNIRAALFADAGQVFETPEDLNLDDMAVGAGLGLRFGTRLGVIRLDAAIPVSEDGKPQFYFAIGQAF